MVTVNLYIKTERKDKRGFVPVVLRIYHANKTINKTIDFRINPKYWDAKKQRVTSEHPNYKEINGRLNEFVDEACAVVDHSVITKNFNRSLIREKLAGQNTDSVVEFWRIKFNQFVVSGYKPDTKKSFDSELRKFEKFAKDITFNELNPEFVLRYQAYMRNTLNNVDSTVRRSMKRVKQVFILAEQLLEIKIECFKYYKMPTATRNIESLEYQEIERLMGALINDTWLTGMYKRTLESFLLQCFTGMRYSNAKEFAPAIHIKNDWVDFVSIKTGEQVFVPVHEKLQLLLDLTGGIFKSPANAVMNRNLKELMQRYEINRKVTTHTAVHSFCTVSIELGVPIEVVQSWRGHKSIHTTMIYTHIRNAHSKDMMKKWDNASNHNHL